MAFTLLCRLISFSWKPVLYDGTKGSDWIVFIQKESSQCRSHRTDGCTGVKRLEHVLYGHVPTWLTRAPGFFISPLRVPDAYRPASSMPILALFASPSPFISQVYSTALLP